MPNVIAWFEIPVADVDRAKSFYQQVFGISMTVRELGPNLTLVFFPNEPPGVGGALAFGPHYQPSEQGAVIYLDGGPDLNVPLSRVEAAGGSVIRKRYAIGANGFAALFRDTEGNRVALHEPPS